MIRKSWSEENLVDEWTTAIARLCRKRKVFRTVRRDRLKAVLLLTMTGSILFGTALAGT
jgi:hypothetical protein